MAAAATSPTQVTGTGLELVPARGRSGIAALTLRPGRHTLGSDPSCDLCLDAEGVAPQYCLIIAGPQKTIIKALSPLTWINDGPVVESALRSGDRLIVGPVELVVRSIPLPEADSDFASSSLWESGGMPPASKAGQSPPPPAPAPEPPPLPPITDVANLLRSAEGSSPLSLPPSLPVPATVAPSLSVPRPARTLLRGESTFEIRATEGRSAVPPVDDDGQLTGGESGGAARLSERERAIEVQEQELARARARLEGEREALADREARLGDVEQERRILARKLEEMQRRLDREQELSADLERERSVVAALRLELDEARRSPGAEETWDGQDRRNSQIEELEGLRREVESLTKKLAGARTSNPETDRSSLLQQRTELLAIRREAQEKLAEQQRMAAELDQARQALQGEAEEFRRLQSGAEEEFARVEQRMTDLESRESTLSARERAVQSELGQIAALQESLAKQSERLEEREAGLAALQLQLDEQSRRHSIAQVETAELRRREEALAAREAELDRVAAELESELQRIERSADEQRRAGGELEVRRMQLEEWDRDRLVAEEALERRRRELDESEQHIRRRQADLDALLAAQDERRKAQEEAEEALSHRIRQSDEEVRGFEERLAELRRRERDLHDREEALKAASPAERSNGPMPLTDVAPDARDRSSLAEIQQQVLELDHLRKEIDERQRRQDERERALEEHMRAIVLADAERAHWTREHDRLASQIAEMEERVEEWRLQEAALAESRIFITSRERAIDARLIELERREARLSERESLVASVDMAPAPATPVPLSIAAADALPLDRELEAARLNAESLAQRERELDGKFEALGRREAALDNLAASLRRREAELEEREEVLGTPGPSSAPGSSAISHDSQELQQLENELRLKSAAMDVERQEIDRLRRELTQHREAFLEQFRNLEKERAEFYSDQQALGDQVAGFEEERAAFLLERQAFEEERLLSEVPLEENGLPRWNGGLDDQSLAPAPYDQVPPHRSDRGPVPGVDPAMPIHDETPSSSRRNPGSAGRSPFSTFDADHTLDNGNDPSAADDGPFAEPPRMATLEMEREVEAEQPEVQTSDALELRAHLADLFGIDLSRRRAPQRGRELQEIETPTVEEARPQPIEMAPVCQPQAPRVPETSESHEDVDVAAYMERLLARSRTSASGASALTPLPGAATITTSVEPNPAPESAVDSSEKPEVEEEEVSRPARRPLQQQERDAIRGSMDSFREVANRTARAAVARHQLVKLRNTLSTKAMLAGFCGVVTIILVVPEIWGSDRYRLPALGCICLTVIAALEWLRTKVRIKKLDDFVAESDVSKDPALDQDEPAAS